MATKKLTRKKVKRTSAKNAHPRARLRSDPRLADAIVALRLNALLPPKTRKALTRLRKRRVDRDAVLAQALHSVLPMDVIGPLLKRDGLEVGGDWLGVFLGIDTSLRLLEQLAAETGLGRSTVGTAVLWRLGFFELAVRIAAACFASSPDETPTLRHDLWAAERGFGAFLKQLLRDVGVTKRKLGDVLVERRLAKDNVEKSQLDRWLYGEGLPQAENIGALCRGLAIASGSDSPENVARLRASVHLFVGCRNAYERVRGLLGDDRAGALAQVFAKQVHVTFSQLQSRGRAQVSGPNGPIPPAAWLDERRRLARKAAFFGIRPGGLGCHLLYDLDDPDLALLVWPSTSMLFEEPDDEFSKLLDEQRPGYIKGRRLLLAAARALTLDDVVSDASIASPGRQPLGLFGLVERVLGMRLPM